MLARAVVIVGGLWAVSHGDGTPLALGGAIRGSMSKDLTPYRDWTGWREGGGRIAILVSLGCRGKASSGEEGVVHAPGINWTAVRRARPVGWVGWPLERRERLWKKRCVFRRWRWELTGEFWCRYRSDGQSG